MIRTLRCFSCVHDKTRTWLKKAIIGPHYGKALCPFAFKYEVEGTVKIHVSAATTLNEALTDVESELDYMFSPNNKTETTLLVLSESGLLRDYRDFVHASWDVMSLITDNDRFANKCQVVNFHPAAKHSLYADIESAADYTIRSPYPIFHLLKEESIMAALRVNFIKDPEGIPDRNAKRLHKLGLEECKRRYAELL